MQQGVFRVIHEDVAVHLAVDEPVLFEEFVVSLAQYIAVAFDHLYAVLLVALHAHLSAQHVAQIYHASHARHGGVVLWNPCNRSLRSGNILAALFHLSFFSDEV